MVDDLFLEVKFVTLCITYEDGTEERYTTDPFIASLSLLELPFLEGNNRPVKAKIIWGRNLDTWNY